METSKVLLIFFILCSISVLCIIFLIEITHYCNLKKELQEYRKLVPQPSFLLQENARFSCVGSLYRNFYRVNVFDHQFDSKAIYVAAQKDLSHLMKQGHSVSKVFFSKDGVPLENNKAHSELTMYAEKLKAWHDQDQGRPDIRTKPEAPHVYMEDTVVPVLLRL